MLFIKAKSKTSSGLGYVRKSQIAENNSIEATTLKKWLSETEVLSFVKIS